MSDSEDFLAAIALSILFGVGVLAILEILSEIARTNQPQNPQTVKKILDERGYK